MNDPYAESHNRLAHSQRPLSAIVETEEDDITASNLSLSQGFAGAARLSARGSEDESGQFAVAHLSSSLGGPPEVLLDDCHDLDYAAAATPERDATEVIKPRLDSLEAAKGRFPGESLSN